MKNQTGTFLLVISISVLLMGCDTKTGEPAPANLRIMRSEMSSAPAAMAYSVPSSMEIKDSPPPERMVIKTAHVTSEVENYDSASIQLQNIVTQKKGFVVSSTITSPGGSRKSGTMTIRVPSGSFEETLEEISKLSSRVLSKSITGNDITEEYYDLSARLENKRKVENRYREILKSAKTVEDILSVERYLGNVREEIDRMEGRKRFLSDKVSLSTISVNFHEPQAIVEYEGEGFWRKVGNGFRRGLNGFGDVLSYSIAFLISAIPAIVLLGMIVFITLKLLKKYRVQKNKAV